MSASGTDYLGEQRTFKVWDAGGGSFELRDNGHPGASEIRIHDYQGDSLVSSVCGTKPIAQHTADEWPPSDTSRREEVSAVHNVGEAVTFFKNKFGRNGMHHTNGPLRACVHGTRSAFYAAYALDDSSLYFRQATGGDGPSVATQDVVTHEFAHGISHALVGFSDDTVPRSVNEGLSDYWGARSNNNDPCMARDMIDTLPCMRYLHLDSMTTAGDCGGTDSAGPHCRGIRLSAALLATAVASSGAFANAVDVDVYQATGSYITSLMTLAEAARAIVQRAHDQHNSTIPILESALWYNGLVELPGYTVQLSVAYCANWSFAINNNTDPYYLTFEIGSNGVYPDGGVFYPDSSIDLGQRTAASINLGQDETDYHSTTDGHYHGLRARFTDSYGYLDYYDSQAPEPGGPPCDGNVALGPTTAVLPRRFAVRQAIHTPGGSSAALSGSPSVLTVGAQIRQHGLTSLDVDIPVGTAEAPIEVTVVNPQGRVVRRFATGRVGPGTQRVPWDRKNDGGQDAPAGVYVVLVRHGGYSHRTHFIIPAGQ